MLTVMKVIDYSLLVGIDTENQELVVGIIDYLRHYDWMKQIEHGVKLGAMIAGKREPTIVAPSAYQRRFEQAMQRYFMTVPDKWGFLSNV